MGATTTSSGFIRNVEDITVKPTRYQSEVAVEVDDTTTATRPTEVPSIITPERAIKYFQENAVGDLKPLYDYTVSILKKSLTKEVTKPV